MVVLNEPTNRSDKRLKQLQRARVKRELGAPIPHNNVNGRSMKLRGSQTAKSVYAGVFLNPASLSRSQARAAPRQQAEIKVSELLSAIANGEKERGVVHKTKGASVTLRRKGLRNVASAPGLLAKAPKRGDKARKGRKKQTGKALQFPPVSSYSHLGPKIDAKPVEFEQYVKKLDRYKQHLRHEEMQRRLRVIHSHGQTQQQQQQQQSLARGSASAGADAGVSPLPSRATSAVTPPEREQKEASLAPLRSDRGNRAHKTGLRASNSEWEGKMKAMIRSEVDSSVVAMRHHPPPREVARPAYPGKYAGGIDDEEENPFLPQNKRKPRVFTLSEALKKEKAKKQVELALKKKKERMKLDFGLDLTNAQLKSQENVAFAEMETGNRQLADKKLTHELRLLEKKMAKHGLSSSPSGSVIKQSNLGAMLASKQDASESSVDKKLDYLLKTSVAQYSANQKFKQAGRHARRLAKAQAKLASVAFLVESKLRGRDGKGPPPGVATLGGLASYGATNGPKEGGAGLRRINWANLDSSRDAARQPIVSPHHSSWGAGRGGGGGGGIPVFGHGNNRQPHSRGELSEDGDEWEDEGEGEEEGNSDEGNDPFLTSVPAGAKSESGGGGASDIYISLNSVKEDGATPGALASAPVTPAVQRSQVLRAMEKLSELTSFQMRLQRLEATNALQAMNPYIGYRLGQQKYAQVDAIAVSCSLNEVQLVSQLALMLGFHPITTGDATLQARIFFRWITEFCRVQLPSPTSSIHKEKSAQSSGAHQFASQTSSSFGQSGGSAFGKTGKARKLASHLDDLEDGRVHGGSEGPASAAQHAAVSAASALQTRVLDSLGFAALFYALCECSALPCLIIKGLARGNPGWEGRWDRFRDTVDKGGVRSMHYWNAVWWGNTWHMVDCCWSSGVVSWAEDAKAGGGNAVRGAEERGLGGKHKQLLPHLACKFEKSFSDVYFDCDRELFDLQHKALAVVQGPGGCTDSIKLEKMLLKYRYLMQDTEEAALARWKMQQDSLAKLAQEAENEGDEEAEEGEGGRRSSSVAAPAHNSSSAQTDTSRQTGRQSAPEHQFLPIRNKYFPTERDFNSSLAFGRAMLRFGVQLVSVAPDADFHAKYEKHRQQLLDTIAPFEAKATDIYGIADKPEHEDKSQQATARHMSLGRKKDSNTKQSVWQQKIRNFDAAWAAFRDSLDKHKPRKSIARVQSPSSPPDSPKQASPYASPQRQTKEEEPREWQPSDPGQIETKDSRHRIELLVPPGLLIRARLQKRTDRLAKDDDKMDALKRKTRKMRSLLENNYHNLILRIGKDDRFDIERSSKKRTMEYREMDGWAQVSAQKLSLDDPDLNPDHRDFARDNWVSNVVRLILPAKGDYQLLLSCKSNSSSGNKQDSRWEFLFSLLFSLEATPQLPQPFHHTPFSFSSLATELQRKRDKAPAFTPPNKIEAQVCGFLHPHPKLHLHSWGDRLKLLRPLDGHFALNVPFKLAVCAPPETHRMLVCNNGRWQELFVGPTEPAKEVQLVLEEALKLDSTEAMLAGLDLDLLTIVKGQVAIKTDTLRNTNTSLDLLFESDITLKRFPDLRVFVSYEDRPNKFFMAYAHRTSSRDPLYWVDRRVHMDHMRCLLDRIRLKSEKRGANGKWIKLVLETRPGIELQVRLKEGWGEDNSIIPKPASRPVITCEYVNEHFDVLNGNAAASTSAGVEANEEGGEGNVGDGGDESNEEDMPLPVVGTTDHEPLDKLRWTIECSFPENGHFALTVSSSSTGAGGMYHFATEVLIHRSSSFRGNDLC